MWMRELCWGVCTLLSAVQWCLLLLLSDNDCVAFQVAVVSKNVKQLADGKQPSMKVDYDDCNTTSLSLYYSSSNDGKQPSMKVDYDDCNTTSLSLLQ